MRSQEGVLRNKTNPITGGGRLWKRTPSEQGGCALPDSLKHCLLESQRKSPWAWKACPGGRTNGWNARMKRIPGAVMHEQQLRQDLALSRRDGCLLSHCPRGLSVTGLSSHQRRSRWRVALTLPLATTLHCIPGEGRRPENLRVGMGITEDLVRSPPMQREKPLWHADGRAGWSQCRDLRRLTRTFNF